MSEKEQWEAERAAARSALDDVPEMSLSLPDDNDSAATAAADGSESGESAVAAAAAAAASEQDDAAAAASAAAADDDYDGDRMRTEDELIRAAVEAEAQQRELERQAAEAAGADSGDEAAGGIHFAGDQLFCAGLEWAVIPEDLPQRCEGHRVRRLDLSSNCLRTLANLANFADTVEELILDSNRIDDDVQFPELPHLHTLMLNKNRITDVEELIAKLQKSCPNVTYLSLLGNEACPNELVAKDEDDYQRYRYLVLYLFPTLRFLDSRPVTAAELKEAKRVGSFMKVVRFDAGDEDTTPVSSPSQSQSAFSPLPQDLRDASSHRATIGTCKYVYYGRHSEGNRFIRNNDL